MISIYRITMYENHIIENYFKITDYNNLDSNTEEINTLLSDIVKENQYKNLITTLYIIDQSIAVKYPDGYYTGDDYITNRNTRRSYIKYNIDHKQNIIRRYDGYGLLDTSLPYEDTFRSELNDNELELYRAGTMVNFVKPFTNKILTGIILDTSYDSLRIYEIYCFEEDDIYNDDKESIHNNDIVKVIGFDPYKLKDIINKYSYMYDQDYINEINNL